MQITAFTKIVYDRLLHSLRQRGITNNDTLDAVIDCLDRDFLVGLRPTTNTIRILNQLTDSGPVSLCAGQLWFSHRVDRFILITDVNDIGRITWEYYDDIADGAQGRSCWEKSWNAAGHTFVAESITDTSTDNDNITDDVNNTDRSITETLDASTPYNTLDGTLDTDTSVFEPTDDDTLTAPSSTVGVGQLWVNRLSDKIGTITELYPKNNAGPPDIRWSSLDTVDDPTPRQSNRPTSRGIRMSYTTFLRHYAYVRDNQIA